MPAPCISMAVRRISATVLHRRGSGARGGRCTSQQSNTHSTESREVLYPWHPWFGRAVWIFARRMAYGRMVVHCGLEPRHESRGVEIPQWMFDTAVCCQMRMVQEPVASIDALRELKALRATGSPASPDPMLQAQHDSLPKGGADANPTEPAPRDPTCIVSVEPGRAALGTAAVGGAAADDALAGADVERTGRTQVGFPSDAGGRR
jgi:hypothetical protein